MKRFFFLLSLLISFSIGQIWAAEESVTLSAGAFNTDRILWTVANGNISITQLKGSSSTAVSSSYIASPRVYKGHVLSFVASDGYKINSIEITYNGSYCGNSMTAGIAMNGNTVTDNTTAISRTWSTTSGGKHTISAAATEGESAIYIQNVASSSNKQLRPTAITITYTASGGGTPKCVTPTFSPAAGSYEGTQNVTISSTSGATIYYTTDGSTPTTSSSVYSAAIPVAADMTIKAYAVKDGSNDSEVATAAYTITEGPDVTINLLDEGWGFPTSKVVNETSYTNGNYTIKVAGTTGNGFRTYGTYFLLGQSGAYIELPAFANPIEKIVVTGNSNGSASVAWNIFKGDNAVSTAASGCKNDAYTFNIDPVESNVVYRLKVTNAANLQIKAIKIYYGEAPAVAKPTISGDVNFVSSTTVTISHDDADHIYYTIDGSTPTTSSTEYSAPFSLTNTATVKAIAVKGSDESAAAEKTFTKATVLSVAEARAAIDAGGDLTNKYVAGIISQIDSYNSTYNSITYWISDDGTTTDQLQVYSGLAGVVKAQFESVNDLAVGDDVTVKGTLKKYNSTYEFDKNNTIEAYKPIARLAWSAENYDASLEGTNTFPALTNTYGVDVTYSSSDAAKASFDDASVYDITLNAVGSTTITASFAGNETYKANSVSYTLNVASSLVMLTYNVDGGEAIDPVNVSALPNPLPTTTKAGKNFGGWFTDPEKEVAAVPGAAISENTTLYAKWLDPYTVAEAKTVIDANPDGIANQYVAGIISQIDSYNNTYHSITYWISADGATTNQLQVYSGLIGNAATALGKDDFSAKEDLELGDEVVVTGTLKLHNSTTYEFDKNNTIYTFSRKASAGLEYAVTAVNKVVGDADFVNELTNPNSVAVTYATSDDQVAEVANDGTVTIIGEGTATISATFAGNETYKAAVVSYTLTVSATVDTRHIANGPATFTTTNGNLDPADIAYASYQGGAGNPPAIYNDGIRLYQISGSNTFGGFITLTAKLGCTIDEVQITTTSKYATTVAYSKDGNETLLGSESVAKSGSYTTGTGLNVSSVNILNLGTGSDGRLEIASITVYYTGEALTIDHYELGGTYATVFEVGDEFNHNGLIVYAAFDASGENKSDITSSCTFSTPDMSTEGDKTIEITYNDAVVKSYTITVNASTDTRKVANSPETFTAVSGDMNPADITFASYKGGAGNDPYLASGSIRLYQISGSNTFGGFITLKAKKGCTIDQVKITTTNSYATTVAYSVDGNENLLGSESVAKSSDYSTPSGLNVESVNIVNKGTSSSGRLEIASIKVWYTGDALPVHHYILGGTYETTFEQYGTFSYEGLTVTAAYDAGATITEAVTGFTVEADLSTAGAKKANVMLNSVKIAEYDITVTASAKTDPALAYSPASVILTFGQSLTAPTFSNDHNVSPITYSSDKPAVATVDAEGNIALAGGTGVAVITASFAGNDDYIESEATFTITVNEPAEDLTGTWVLATSVAAGDKIIIGATYQDATKSMGAQNGNNRLAVASTLDAGVLSPGEGTKVFTLVDAGDGKFAIQALNGNYLSAAGTGTSNYLKEAADYTADNAKWSISIDGEGVASVVALSENRNAMQYNSGSTLFSCYASVTSQRPINIYKKSAQPEPELTYEALRPGLEQGRFYSACVANNIIGVQGGILWDISYYEGSKVYFEEIVVSPSKPLTAGKPFICYTASNDFKVAYGNQSVPAPVVDENSALRGTFSPMTQIDFNDASTANGGSAIYIISNNQLRQVAGCEGNSLAANRAYLIFSKLTEGQPNPAPGRRVMTMTVGENVATDIDFCNGETINASKIIRNGQILIIRDGKTFDVTGREMK